MKGFNIQSRKAGPNIQHPIRRTRTGWKGAVGVTAALFTLLLAAAIPLPAATDAVSPDIPVLSPPLPELPRSSAASRQPFVIGIVVAAAGLLAAVAAWRWRRLRQAASVPIEIQTRRELEELGHRAEDGVVLSRVSRCLRRYLTAAFALPPEELTTAELCRAMAVSPAVGPDLEARAGDFLRRLDELKFAPEHGAGLTVGSGARQGIPAGSAITGALELVELGEARRAELRAASAPATPASA